MTAVGMPVNSSASWIGTSRGWSIPSAYTSARRCAEDETGWPALAQGLVAGGLIAIAAMCKVGGIALLAPALAWAALRAPRAGLVRGLGVIQRDGVGTCGGDPG